MNPTRSSSGETILVGGQAIYQDLPRPPMINMTGGWRYHENKGNEEQLNVKVESSRQEKIGDNTCKLRILPINFVTDICITCTMAIQQYVREAAKTKVHSIIS